MLDVMERLDPREAVLYLGGTFADPATSSRGASRLAAGLADRVALLGRVPPPELPRYLGGGRRRLGAVEPRSTQYSDPTVPTKLYEGMAVGLAALVSDLPGRGELVRREACGLAVRPAPTATWPACAGCSPTATRSARWAPRPPGGGRPTPGRWSRPIW